MLIPTWANDPNLLGIFCQMGWFNHQTTPTTPPWHGRWWMRFEVWEVMGRTGLMLQKSQGQPTVWMVLNTLLNNWDIFTNLNWLISRISSTSNNFSPGKKNEPTFEPPQSLRASPTKIHQILEKSSSSKQPPWLVGVFFLEAWSLTNRWTLGFSPSFLKMQFVDFLFV